MAKTILEMRLELHTPDDPLMPNERLASFIAALGQYADAVPGQLWVLRTSAYREPEPEPVPEPEVPMFPEVTRDQVRDMTGDDSALGELG